MNAPGWSRMSAEWKQPLGNTLGLADRLQQSLADYSSSVASEFRSDFWSLFSLLFSRSDPGCAFTAGKLIRYSRLFSCALLVRSVRCVWVCGTHLECFCSETINSLRGSVSVLLLVNFWTVPAFDVLFSLEYMEWIPCAVGAETTRFYQCAGKLEWSVTLFCV